MIPAAVAGALIYCLLNHLWLPAGLIIGAAHADRIVKIFQQAEDRAEARKKIETTYKLTPIQSEVIASMTLAQVTRLDAGKYAKEKEELQARISELNLLFEKLDGNEEEDVTMTYKDATSKELTVYERLDDEKDLQHYFGNTPAPLEWRYVIALPPKGKSSPRLSLPSCR